MIAFVGEGKNGEAKKAVEGCLADGCTDSLGPTLRGLQSLALQYETRGDPMKVRNLESQDKR